MSALTDIIPPAHRKTVYAVFAVAGLILGAMQVGYSSVNEGQPTWLTVALAVFAFLGGAVGVTATANTPADGPTGGDDGTS